MTRELKLALIVSFVVLLGVVVLISDHLSKARQATLPPLANATGSVSDPIPAPGALPARGPVLGADPGAPDVELPPTRIVQAPANPELDSERSVSAQDPMFGVAVPNRFGPDAYTPPPVHIDQSRPRNPEPQNSDLRNSNSATAEPRLATRAPSSPDSELMALLRKNGFTVEREGDQDVIRPIAAVQTRQVQDRAPSSSADRDALVATPGEPRTEANRSATRRGTNDTAYKVASGDRLISIAKRFYGDGSLWRELARYNAGVVGLDGSVREGQTLRIPPKETLAPGAKPVQQADTRTNEAKRPTPATRTARPAEPERRTQARSTETAPKSPEKPRTYTVRAGDSLSSIAQRVLGSSRRAGELMALNDLDDEDHVQAGLTLILPK
ncbi:MAG: LysM peptidoglycan-binding domain-containing protein [Planctomycetota bacterium]|nr:LysM peptidoglycan-binding domain-containing protein [Planctomycetota bacterium]